VTTRDGRLDRLHVEVRPEVGAELEAGLRDGVGLAEVLINGEPAVEPLPSTSRPVSG